MEAYGILDNKRTQMRGQLQDLDVDMQPHASNKRTNWLTDYTEQSPF